MLCKISKSLKDEGGKPMFVFGSFRFDVANASLKRGKQAIVLTPKALNVLYYLVEHAGQLVTKDDLWRAVWPRISVTDATLTMCVSELRKALRDPSNTPRYIETVHRLGYRFIAPVSTEPDRFSNSAVARQEFDTRDAGAQLGLGSGFRFNMDTIGVNTLTPSYGAKVANLASVVVSAVYGNNGTGGSVITQWQWVHLVSAPRPAL